MRLSDAFLTWRDRVLSSPGFQRWAASFPLTRPLARSQERRLFDLVAGFVHSQVLSACVQLDLFSRLTQPQTPDALAQALTLPPDALTRLLDAAIALGLLETRAEGRVGLGMLGAALLGNPGAVAMIEHHALLYRDLADPVALLRGPPPGGTALARYWAYGTQEAGEVAAYSTLMAASNSLVSADILDAWPLAGTRRLLDIGGGEGVFLEAALRRAPALEGMLFDLPAVAARAEET
ncbi:methyltransferase [Pararhodospirillum photometricum]|uniref:methyltransferase n=1 Tax=Pararhodospirillum photometricum TaxID=1084 RepID=UPI000684B2ED|nr:methyltransferase [Pararhodospirillum photometricum]